MREPVLGSRALARNIAKSFLPSSALGVRALVAAAQLVSMMPARLTSALARLNDKGIRLYDSMHVPDYPIPVR